MCSIDESFLLLYGIVTLFIAHASIYPARTDACQYSQSSRPMSMVHCRGLLNPLFFVAQASVLLLAPRCVTVSFPLLQLLFISGPVSRRRTDPGSSLDELRQLLERGHTRG